MIINGKPHRYENDALVTQERISEPTEQKPIACTRQLAGEYVRVTDNTEFNAVKTVEINPPVQQIFNRDFQDGSPQFYSGMQDSVYNYNGDQEEFIVLNGGGKIQNIEVDSPSKVKKREFKLVIEPVPINV